MSVKLLVTVHQTQVNDLMCSASFIDKILGIYLMFKGDCYPNAHTSIIFTSQKTMLTILL